MAKGLRIPEAAQALGVHPDTVKRRLDRGLLRGRKQTTPQGYVWVVDIEDDDADREARDARQQLVHMAEIALDALREENRALRDLLRLALATREPQTPANPLPKTRGPREKQPPHVILWRWLTKT